MIRNQDQHSKDYSEIAGYYRPGHADCAFDKNMVPGLPRGGRSSAGNHRPSGGRAVAKILEGLGVRGDGVYESNRKYPGAAGAV